MHGTPSAAIPIATAFLTAFFTVFLAAFFTAFFATFLTLFFTVFFSVFLAAFFGAFFAAFFEPVDFFAMDASPQGGWWGSCRMLDGPARAISGQIAPSGAHCSATCRRLHQIARRDRSHPPRRRRLY